LRISNGKRLPAAQTSIPAVFHRKSILSALLALIFLSFFGTLTLSASMSVAVFAFLCAAVFLLPAQASVKR